MATVRGWGLGRKVVDQERDSEARGGSLGPADRFTPTLPGLLIFLPNRTVDPLVAMRRRGGLAERISRCAPRFVAPASFWVWPWLARTGLLTVGLVVDAIPTEFAHSRPRMKTMPVFLGAILLLADLPGRAEDSRWLEAEVPAGTNYAVAAFRFWHPLEAKVLRGVLVLVPGSNADGRAMAQEPFWQTFARQHDLGLLGCCLKDRPHENMNIEEYARAGAGSGAALLEALTRLAKSASRPEIAHAPLLLWGQSAGGEFNYEFACWKPERVLAFTVNKGGYYFTHLAPPATRRVPGIFFIGGKDEEFRILSIRGIYAVNQRAGAVWKLVAEPEEGHEVGKTRAHAVQFFEETLAQSHEDFPPSSRRDERK